MRESAMATHPSVASSSARRTTPGASTALDRRDEGASASRHGDTIVVETASDAESTDGSPIPARRARPGRTRRLVVENDSESDRASAPETGHAESDVESTDSSPIPVRRGRALPNRARRIVESDSSASASSRAASVAAESQDDRGVAALAFAPPERRAATQARQALTTQHATWRDSTSDTETDDAARMQQAGHAARVAAAVHEYQVRPRPLNTWSRPPPLERMKTCSDVRRASPASQLTSRNALPAAPRPSCRTAASSVRARRSVACSTCRKHANGRPTMSLTWFAWTAGESRPGSSPLSRLASKPASGPVKRARSSRHCSARRSRRRASRAKHTARGARSRPPQMFVRIDRSSADLAGMRCMWHDTGAQETPHAT